MNKKRHKQSLTIGIPAYNEGRNIGHLIKSILDQNQENFKIDRIYVVCDGCTDNTVEIVRTLSKKYQFIKYIARKKRFGKAEALNKIYDLNKSDYLLTIDADLVFTNNISLENMMEEITKNKNVQVVGPRHIPALQKSLMGNFAYVSYVSFEDAFLKFNSGNNFYAMMGAGLMRKSLADSFRYPNGTISDQCYLYAKATRKNKNGFRLVKSAEVYFWPVSTFKDWRLLGMRSVIGDKEDLAKHFGRDILKEYSIPKKLFYASLIKWFIKSPFYTTGSILMNLYIRKFPYKKVTPKNGIWETTISNKKAIYI